MNKFKQAIQEELQWIKEELLSINNQLSSEITPQRRIELQIKTICLENEQSRLRHRISN